MINYEYLKKFIPGGSGLLDNWFVPLVIKDIDIVEKRIGFPFPDQLRQFYTDIGYGCIRSPIKVTEGYDFVGANEIMSPSEVASILLEGHESGLISQDVLDMMQPGDMPFFHIADSCLFLIMRPRSKTPNAVYTQWGDLVEENFSDLIWKLYHISPRYYEDVL